MIKKMDNPYAFPCLADAGQWGMELRDYFAAKAMEAGIGRWGGDGSMYDEGGITHSRLAEESYKIADAMLQVRKT